MQIIQKTIIICRNISLVIAIWPDTLIAYIALNPIFTFLRQFHPRDLANFAGKYHHLLLHRCSHHLLLSSSLLALWVIAIDLAAALPDIFLNWQPYLMVSSFLSPPSNFSALFCCNKFMSISFIEKFTLSWEIVLGSFLNIFHDQWVIVTVKKDYSKGQVDVVEITQIKIQKMKKNVAMASFCCSVSKIWKKIVFYVAIRMQKKTPDLCCFLSAKN